MIEYKWLPSEPSKEMKKYVSKYQSIVDYKQMWKDAPEVEQKPFGYVYQNGNNFVFSEHHFSDTKNTALIPLYTAPQYEQKPVGYADAESITYLLEGGDSGILIVPVPTDTRDTPLYAHSPKREPLSEEEIFNLFTQQNFTAYKIHDGTDHNDAVAVDRAFVDFVRAIEKAHGIGVEK